MRHLPRILIGLCVSILGLSCSGSPSAPGCSDYEATSTVEMRDFAFGNTCLEAEAGDTLDLTNTGDAPHTFTVKGTDLAADVPASQDGTLTLNGVTSGTVYTVICIYHSQMTAALKIT